MSDYDFYTLAADNLSTLLLIIASVTLASSALAWRLTGAFFDPLVVYVATTLGTSWGVVAFLADQDYLTIESLTLVPTAVLLLAVGMVSSAAGTLPRANHPFDEAASLPGGLFRLLAFSIVLSAAMFATVGNVVMVESRFESLRGFGFIVRLLDPCRLLLAGYLGWKLKRDGAWGEALVLFAYLAVLCVITGARFSIIDTALASAVAYRVTAQRGEALSVEFGWSARLLGMGTLAIVAIGIAAAMTSAAFTARGGDADLRTSFFPDLPLVAELLLLRVLASGDMYFFSLPNNVLFRVVDIANPVAQLLGPIVGDTVMRKLFDYPLGNLEVGRQIWLHWYARDTITRGSTSHFELVAWAYFGWAGGALFVIFLGLLLGRLVARVKTLHTSDPLLASFAAALYVRAMTALLSPALAIAFILDLLVVAAVLAGRPFAGLRCAERLLV